MENINGWYYLLDEVLGQSKHLAVKSKTDETQCMDRPNTILPWITLQRVTLKRSADGKYGFTILDTMPVQVGSVEKGSTACSAGLRKGDAFLELGGANVAGIKSRALADILKKADTDIQALIQRTGDRSQRPLPPPPLQTHTAPAKIKHKDVKAIAKAKAKAATVRRAQHNPSYFRDRPRSLPLLEQRLKRELAAKLAARKARQHLQNSRKRRQKDDILEPKPEPLDANEPEPEDIYANSQPEGYYLIPMSQDDSSSEDSQPEAEYATIHHSNRSSTAAITPGGISVCDTSPPPPPPPQHLCDPNILPDLDTLENNNIDTYDVKGPPPATLLAEDKENASNPPLPSIEEIEKSRPKLVKSLSENTECIYENDRDLRLSVCKFAADDFGHVYENLDEHVHGELDLREDVTESQVTDMERYVEGAADDGKARSSVSMQSVKSYESSETNTPLSAITTDESMSAEEMELPTENVTENILWAKGVKPFRMGPPGRNLIHVGRLFVKTKKKKLREMMVILFSDILVFCKPLTDSRLKVLYRPLLLNDISILDFKRKIAREFCIKLVAGAERHPVACLCNSLIFRTPTAKLKNVWKKVLKRQLMTVKCSNDTLKGLDGRNSQTDFRPCNMDSNNEGEHNPTATVLQNKMVHQPDVNVSEKAPAKEEVQNSDEIEIPEISSRTNCEDNPGHKPAKLSQVGPTSNSLEEKKAEGKKMKKLSKIGSSEEKTKVPDGEVEYENMDIVRKLRAALNTSNSNHNNRKILEYSSTSAQSSPALQHNPIERITMSAPSSPAMKAPLQSLQRRLLHRHSSPSRSPTKDSGSDGSNKPRRRGLFKRLSGGNRTEVVTAKGSRTLSLEEREAQKKKSIEAQQKARRTLSMGDDHLLRTSPVDQPNSIDAVKEEDETAGELVATTEHNSVNERQPRKSRNIARDLKDKMRFLRRRHTDSSLRDSEKFNCDKSLVPDSEEHARKWAESFEHLLRDQRGLEAFRRFLQTEFSDENIEFWLACEEYKTLKSNKLGLRARKIYDDYVTIQAPREVNLDSRTRLETADLVESPDEHTFDGAQKRIEALMEKDSYPRFLRSEMYHKLLKESKKK